MRRILLLTTVLASLQAGWAPSAHAQGEHHWYNQFGGQSLLLSGAVVGGVSDLSAVFYNPGRIGMMENAGLLLSVKAYQIMQTGVTNGLGQDLDLKQRTFGGMPGLGAGAFRLPFLPGHTFVYSFLTRENRSDDIFMSAEGVGELAPELGGETLITGTLELASTVKDEWFGLSWGKKLSSRVGVGLSGWGTAATRNTSVTTDVRGLSEANRSAILLGTQGYSFSSYGLVLKGGLAVDLTPFELGLTVTTPRVALFGSGTSRLEALRAGVDPRADGPNDDLYTVNRQENLPSDLKTPTSVGMGVTWRGNHTVVHWSGEWFAPVSKYTVLAPAPVVSQGSGNVLHYQIVDELRSVFNVGVGIEWRMTDMFSTYASVASDASAAPAHVTRLPAPNGDLNLNTYKGTVFHAGGGVAVRTKWLELTTGVTYGGSTEDLERSLTIPPAAENATLTLKTWRILVGFDIPQPGRSG